MTDTQTKTRSTATDRQNALRKLQRNFNKDGSITVYDGGHKLFRGPEKRADLFIKKHYGRQPIVLRKDTHT